MTQDARSWLDEARRQADAGHYLRTLEAARRVVGIGGPLVSEARVEAIAALTYLQRHDEAEAEFAHLDENVSLPLLTRGRLLIAYGRTLSGDLETAEPEAIRGLADAQTVGGDRTLSLARVVESRLLQAQERPVEAIVAADRALEHGARADPVTHSTALYHLGYLWLDLGVFDRAAEAFTSALELEGVPEPREAAIRIGSCLASRQLGDLEAAEQHASRAIQIHESGERIYREGTARIALAETLHDRGRIADAILQADRAIGLFRRAHSIVMEMEGRLCLGKLKLTTDDPAAGVEQLERVLDEPAARTLHAEARVLLGERARTPDDPAAHHLEAVLEMTQTTTQTPPELCARAALALGRLHLDTDPRTADAFMVRFGELSSAAGARQARRRYRVVEIREQVEALRRERRRTAELAEALATQERLRKVAEDAEAERRDLLELVAHDLRNPLSALLLMLDGVDEAEDTEEILELIALGRRSATAMRAVLDEALNASGSIGDLGALVPVDLAGVAAASVGAFEAGARAKGQVLRKEVPESLGVQGVEALLRSVLDNLVSNALKFTPRGGEVVVSLTAAKPTARIEVRDNGPGLADGESESLFQRRTKGSARPTAGEPSTGLGLYLVRKVIEGHGGRVGATSAGPGLGSTFWVELPISA